MRYKITIIVLVLLMLTGCWSRRELNELLIVLGVSVDWEDGEYLVSFQVVNPGEISAQKRGGERPPSTLYQGRGKTMFEAARYLTAEAPRKVYMGHLQLFVIGESLARRGIKDFVDSSFRDNEMRMDFNIVVARGTKAENILKLYTPMEKLPSYSMQQSLQTSQKSWAPTVAITMDEVLNKLSGDGFELALTGIQMIGDIEVGRRKENVEYFQPPSRYRYNGIAAFKEDKLIGWLNEDESKGYTDITDHLDSTSIELACAKQEYIGIEVTSSDTKLKTKVINGIPEVTVSIRTESNIVDNPCKDVDLTDPKTITRLEEGAREIMQSHTEATIARAKKFKSDIVGFGSQLGKDHPAYWNSVKENWNDDMFLQTKVIYDIHLFIRQTGTTGNSTVK
ncbi:spore gernimation protein GerC [Paenibacillus pectinilyticus]|uniref:Spore gernimation protein GerC n=1 Tax=Paenibacillus pectinilyticus TaxID=512399 RepID=A0A1C0ZZK6_9BACL|nr:Ger(x)C family spore germination protein [Paenibacillus pectinilyticus]OCT13471.1 spore gernimation protein GerC [Paenibacillus pectinilyticus]